MVGQSDGRTVGKSDGRSLGQSDSNLIILLIFIV